MIKVTYREGCKKKLRRQMEIMGREPDDEQLEEMLEAKDGARVFTAGILLGK